MFFFLGAVAVIDLTSAWHLATATAEDFAQQCIETTRDRRIHLYALRNSKHGCLLVNNGFCATFELTNCCIFEHLNFAR